MVAEAAKWFGHPEVRNRTFTEEHARDSFENMLFSLCRQVLGGRGSSGLGGGTRVQRAGCVWGRAGQGGQGQNCL